MPPFHKAFVGRAMACPCSADGVPEVLIIVRRGGYFQGVRELSGRWVVVIGEGFEEFPLKIGTRFV